VAPPGPQLTDEHHADLWFGLRVHSTPWEPCRCSLALLPAGGQQQRQRWQQEQQSDDDPTTIYIEFTARRFCGRE
jgi:hypothetical protein